MAKYNTTTLSTRGGTLIFSQLRMGSELDDIDTGPLYSSFLEYRIQDCDCQIRQLKEQVLMNETTFMKCVAASGDEGTTDDEAWNEYMGKYLENDAKYKAEISMLKAEKDKIDAELVELNITSSHA